MATSSILTNFTIMDRDAANRFADVLDEAAQQPSRKPTASVHKPLRDSEAIRALMEKREDGFNGV